MSVTWGKATEPFDRRWTPLWSDDGEQWLGLNQPLRRERWARAFCEQHGRLPRVVIDSQAGDVFRLPHFDEISAIFGVMAAAPWMEFFVVGWNLLRALAWEAKISTAGYDPAYHCMMQAARFTQSKVLGKARPDGKWPLSHVWLGVSVEDQSTADERIPLLLSTPAAKRFVSYEPALAPVDFTPWLRMRSTHHLRMSVEGALRNRAFDSLQADDGRALSATEAERELLFLRERGVKFVPCGYCESFSSETGCPGHQNPRLDLVIAGGESGPKARPCNVEWIRAAVQQAKAAGVPFFVKQLGARPVESGCEPGHVWVGSNPMSLQRIRHPKGGDLAEWPSDLRVRETP